MVTLQQGLLVILRYTIEKFTCKPCLRIIKADIKEYRQSSLYTLLILFLSGRFITIIHNVRPSLAEYVGVYLQQGNNVINIQAVPKKRGDLY